MNMDLKISICFNFFLVVIRANNKISIYLLLNFCLLQNYPIHFLAGKMLLYCLEILLKIVSSFAYRELS